MQSGRKFGSGRVGSWLLAALLLSACTTDNPIPQGELSSALAPDTATSAQAETNPGAELEAKLASAGEGAANGRPAKAVAALTPTTEPAPSTQAAAQAAQTSDGSVAGLFFGGSSKDWRNMAGQTSGASKSTITTAPTKRTRVASLAGQATGASSANSRSRSGGSALPGVRIRSLFEVGDSTEVEPLPKSKRKRADTRLAFVPNLAKRGTHGLLLQRPGVKVGCFPRRLVRLLKQVERRYGRTPMVTSGYRSARRNRMVGGSRKSMHVQCMAADIQVQGVSKWRLAKYLRSLSGRGGVGTYCHTQSVHIDIGKRRAWHHCRRKRARRRRS